ncbi:hypothetical protein B296_00014493 [Ensete ventricosum]|uniref:Uncharacterized protein n=1 Tax=Ensete ventricosum TaxID=4639 RepID=A0A426ZN26_ENSVE|nr:hypothetical protein B296_00014493 [Ensete ventricosum]
MHEDNVERWRSFGNGCDAVISGWAVELAAAASGGDKQYNLHGTLLSSIPRVAFDEWTKIKSRDSKYLKGFEEKLSKYSSIGYSEDIYTYRTEEDHIEVFNGLDTFDRPIEMREHNEPPVASSSAATVLVPGRDISASGSFRLL